MLGLLRTTLALIVVTAHLFIGPPSAGNYAVFGFYLISGYLMTLIMHESYGYTALGRYKFASNRALRLYPQYWAAAVFSLILIAVGMGDAHQVMFLPKTFGEVLANITMIFPSWSPIGVTPRLVPPTWGITVEIFFYVLICIGISRTFTLTKIWFGLSVAYVIVSYILGWAGGARYDPVWAASLPFSVGALLYFFSKDRKKYDRFLNIPIPAWVLYVLIIANFFLGTYLLRVQDGIIEELPTYSNIVLCALLIYKISGGEVIVNITKATDKWIADFSYPLYLLQWQVLILVSNLLYGESFREFSLRGAISFGLSLLLATLMSYAFIMWIDKPIEDIRNRVRTKQER